MFTLNVTYLTVGNVDILDEFETLEEAQNKLYELRLRAEKLNLLVGHTQNEFETLTERYFIGTL